MPLSRKGNAEVRTGPVGIGLDALSLRFLWKLQVMMHYLHCISNDGQKSIPHLELRTSDTNLKVIREQLTSEVCF